MLGKYYCKDLIKSAVFGLHVTIFPFGFSFVGVKVRRSVDGTLLCLHANPKCDPDGLFDDLSGRTGGASFEYFFS